MALSGVFTDPSQTAGPLVQAVSTLSSAVATGTTIIPSDDTIPQITEGDEYMTLAITPKSTANILVIQVMFHASHSVAADIVCALFQDATANALAATFTYQATGTGLMALAFNHTMTAGTVASTTFRVRGGGHTAGTMTFNGQSTARRLGGTPQSSILIWEYRTTNG